MSEAPKRVWMRVNMAPKRLMEEKLFDDDVEYIRADIVEEMREALEKLAKLGNGDQYGNSVGNEIARAALKLLEEE